MRDELMQAISAIQDGQAERALGLLVRVIKDEPKNEEAWLWLAVISSTETERQECLEFVLQINPGNQEARRGLLKSRAMGRGVGPSAPVLGPSPEVSTAEPAAGSENHLAIGAEAEATVVPPPATDAFPGQDRSNRENSEGPIQ